MADGANVASESAAFRGGPRDMVRAVETHEGKQWNHLQITEERWAPRDRAALFHATIEAQRALREAADAAASAAMRARSLAAVLDEALAGLPQVVSAGGSAPPPALRTSSAMVPLSPREQDVLALVAEGRSNKAIAEVLAVSPNTVKTHVASLLNKHNAGSRAHLAAIVAGQGFR